MSNELRRRGDQISPAGVRGVWQRHDLETFKKRLAALEKKVAEEGVILTEGQLAALERQRHDDEAVGEIETEHPGYLGSQDTFYVGTLKGVGRIYQQTFVDTYSKWATAKLYAVKTAITAADLLNDRVLPFFEDQGAEVLRILTDRGTEYCGRHDEHPYQLFLAVNDIDHTKTKVKSPQTNGRALPQDDTGSSIKWVSQELYGSLEPLQQVYRTRFVDTRLRYAAWRARIPRALRVACDTPAFRGASTGYSVRRTQRRPAHVGETERPGRTC